MDSSKLHGEWYSKLSKFIPQHGFTQSREDFSLFVKSTQNSFIAILVYVDDIIMAGNFMETINNLKAALNAQLKIKDLGKLKCFLHIKDLGKKSKLNCIVYTNSKV